MSIRSQVKQNIEALGDGSAKVRKQAAINLRTLSPHSEVPIKSLITALKDNSPVARREIARTIAVIGGQSAAGH